MKSHLLMVALGPVQEFIAEARRTRDLWFGSHLLSELSRAAAHKLAREGAELIFPALARDDPELEPCMGVVRDSGRPPLSLANKILAKVPHDLDPQRVAREVREVVRQFWYDTATSVRNECAAILASNVDAVWNEQIETFIEFIAAWVPLEQYARDRKKLEDAIGARKNLRDFVQWREQRRGQPKSSLDGGRATVLARKDRRDPAVTRRYRIDPNEELDAVGLVKRAGGEPEQFVPVVNVAFATWIQHAKKIDADGLDRLCAACKEIGLAQVRRPDLPCAVDFPFDASVLLPSRWSALFQELRVDAKPTDWGQEYVRPLLEDISEPYPYVACLVADGDHVGEAISKLDSPDAHRKLSKSLSEFAVEARRIVEQAHRGSLVYGGGDDILAFLPLPEALPCAAALAKVFGDRVRDWDLTLSVGIGIGHVLEGMGDLLNLGREAESIAKRGTRASPRPRNAVAILLSKRSGGRRYWRARWSEFGQDPPARLFQDAQLLHSKRISTRKLYEIEDMLRRLPEPSDVQDQYWRQILASELQRSLSRVRAGEVALTPADVGLVLHDSYPDLYFEASAWVDRMLIAAALKRADPTSRSPAASAP